MSRLLAPAAVLLLLSVVPAAAQQAEQRNMSLVRQDDADTGMHILELPGPARAIADFPAKAN